MEIRTLRLGEEEAVLELLDGWSLDDGWRGRDFFRRYLHDDPAFRRENLWLAAAGTELFSCVQIFPGEMLLRGTSVPLCGIGTVFTRADVRGRGIASRLLEVAVEDGVQRGLEVGLLLAARRDWYRSRGWRSGPGRLSRLSVPDPPEIHGPGGDLALGPFERRRDLEDVAALHDRLARTLDGCLVRDRAAWERSLRVAGNPGEVFLVARRGAALAGYLRAAILGGRLTITEWGWSRASGESLPRLVHRLAAVDLDSLLPEARAAPGQGRRQQISAPPFVDPATRQAFVRHGFRISERKDPGLMLRCLRPPRIARRLGLDLRPEETANDLLFRALRPERFCFWLADRF